MGRKRDVEICMAPSVALDRRQASTMGGVAEVAILRDYLTECSRRPPDPLGTLIPTTEEWWDTGVQERYKSILSERHFPAIDEKKLRGMRRLKVPDISTWRGAYLRNQVPDFIRRYARSELYEIKPHSVWGILAGIEKLRAIEENLHDLGLDVYRAGTWYPAPPGGQVIANKRVYFFQMPSISGSFAYRLRRMERSMRALGATLDITDVSLEIERRYSGILYYMLCVRMTLDYNGAEAVARRVIRRLYQALTATRKEEDRLREMELAETYRVMDKQGKPLPQPVPDAATQRILKALDTEEQFLLEKVVLVPELESSLASLGQALFTKLRGLPGERFIVCCDETYLENEILLPGKIEAGRLLRRLQIRPPIPVQGRMLMAGMMNVPVSFMLAALYVVGKAAENPRELFHVVENFRKAQRWLELNPAASLVIGSTVVMGTALLVVGTLATSGALLAAPAGGASAGGLSGSVLLDAGASEFGYGLVRALANETMAEAALPVIEETLPLAEQVSSRVTPEAVRRYVAQELQAQARRQIEAAARTQLEKAAARTLLDEVQQDAIRKAVAAGGATLGAVALRYALEGGPRNTPGAAVGPMKTLTVETGSLYLLKLYPDADISKLPQLYRAADYTGFTSEQPGPIFLTDAAITRPKLFHLGVIRCL